MFSYIARFFQISFLLGTLLAAVAQADLLTIEQDGQRIVLSRADLEAYPQISIDTVTPYTEGINRYTGPYLKAVLSDAGVSSETFKMRALNDYVVTVQARELDDIEPIIALEMNGEPMSVRNKGPLWVMLPLSEQPRLDKAPYHRLMIWQLSHIEAYSP